jgi:S-adenosyl methyltransferase
MSRYDAPPGVDVTVPSIARMYDYYLGGKDNFAVDRTAAEKVIAALPDMPFMAQENRKLLRRVVRFLAADAGIRQFLDLGAGLPTQGNVHAIAQQAAPDARVVYVDNDPMVVTHGCALLRDSDKVDVVQADVRDPEKILQIAGDFLDFDQPVAVLMLAVLHFIPDDDDPGQIVASFRDAVPSGSYVAISHVTGDYHPEATEMAKRVYDNDTYSTMRFRSHAEILRFFDGLELLEPGLTTKSLWRPDSLVPPGSEEQWGYGGVGYKP